MQPSPSVKATSFHYQIVLFTANFVLLGIYFWNQSDDDWRRGDVWRL